MKEASPVKFYFAKYFFLVFGVLQWVVAGVLLIRFKHIPKVAFAAFLFFTIGLVCVVTYVFVSDKLKRVAIGKKKVVVMERNRTKEYEWLQVKSVKQIPVIHLYAMKIRGRKRKIYFLPTEHTTSIYGLLSTTPELEVKKSK